MIHLGIFLCIAVLIGAIDLGFLLGCLWTARQSSKDEPSEDTKEHKSC